MADTGRKPGASSGGWHKGRVWRSLAAHIVVVAVGVLDLHLMDGGFLLSRKIIVVLRGGLALALEGRDALSRWDALVRNTISAHLCLFRVLGLDGGRAAMNEALLRRIVASVEIRKVGILDISGLQKRMMIVRCGGVATVEHRVTHGRRLVFWVQVSWMSILAKEASTYS